MTTLLSHPIGFFPPPDRAYLRALRAALRYQVETETFDRTLPGAFHPRANDEWIPRQDYMAVSRRYAHEAKIRARRDVCDVPQSTIDEAEKEALRYPYEKQRELLADLDRAIASEAKREDGAT